MIYNVNLGDTFTGDIAVNTDWSLELSKKGNYFFQRKDIHCRIQLPRLYHFEFKQVGDGWTVPEGRDFATYTNNLAPYFRNVHDDEDKVYYTDVVYVTLDHTVKLINYKTPYDIRYTFRGRPGKDRISKYHGCVVALHDAEELRDLPIFEMIIKIPDGSFESVKVLLNTEDHQIVVNRYPIYKKKTIDVFKKIDKDRRLPRFKIKVEHGLPYLTNIWVVDNIITEDIIEDLLYTFLPYGIAQRTYVLNTESMNEDTVRNVFKEHVNRTEDVCFTMVNDATVPYDLWRETKQNYVFKYNTDSGKLTCMKSI